MEDNFKNQIVENSEKIISETKKTKRIEKVKIFLIKYLSRFKTLNNIRNFSQFSLRNKILTIIFSTIFLTGSMTLIALMVTGESPRNFVNRLVSRENVSPNDIGDWEKLVIPERQPPAFTLNSEKKSKFGLLPTETLVLTADQYVNQNFIEENITASVDVRVNSIGGNKFEISPTKQLSKDEVLTISIISKDKSVGDYTFDRDYSWAFQTQGDFSVVGSLPADEAYSVPNNTGIEIVFSQDDYEDPAKYISISPEIEYRLERYGETLSIVPTKPLEAGEYSVKLSSGLNLLSRDDPIEEDYEFTFLIREDSSQNMASLALRRDLEYSSPTKKHLTEVSYSRGINGDIKTIVYKFPSVDDFVNSRLEYDEFYTRWRYNYLNPNLTSVEGLSKIFEANIQLQEISGENGTSTSYLELPDVLPQGFYLIEYYYDDSKPPRQVWLNSTDLTGFISAGRDSTLVWINEYKGGPVQGATVSPVNASFTSTTDSSGVAVFTPPAYLKDKNEYVWIFDSQNRNLVLPLKSNSWEFVSPGEKKSDDYFSYIYSTRYVYRPGDIIDFWGVVKEIDTSLVPQRVEVVLTEEKSIFVSTQTDGSFSGQIDTEGLVNGYYPMTVLVNGTQVSSLSLNIRDFVKPELKFEVQSNKKAVVQGDKVEFRTQVTFFDGTPASNIPINVGQKEVQANENGLIVYDHLATSYSNNYATTNTVAFSPAKAQSAIETGYGSVLVYPSQIKIEPLVTTENNNALIQAKVSKLLLDKYNAGESTEIQTVPSANTKVDLQVTRRWSEKTESGTYYDFVEKVNKTRYVYQSRSEQVLNTSLTADSQGNISYNLPINTDNRYEVTMTARDDSGKVFQVERWIYNINSYENSSYFSEIRLSDSSKETFSIGESVDIGIYQGDKLVENNDQTKFLFFVANRGRQDVYVNDSPTHSLNFSSEYIPNVYVGGISFNGEYYSRASGSCNSPFGCYFSNYWNSNRFSGLNLVYEKTNSQLDLDIEVSKAKYQPGENAEIRVRVTKNGEAMSNASVNLAVVDEALASLSAIREPDLLDSLYARVQSFIYYNFESHITIFPQNSAEGGGGGGGDRDAFKDDAYFAAATTDSDGYATFNFTLPDNITAWRIYSQAVTTNVDAGQSESSLVATKDFFVTSNFPNTVLKSDIPKLTLATYGIGTRQNDPVKLSAEFLSGENVLARSDRDSSVYKIETFDFPVLETGEYLVRGRAEANSKNDGVVLPLKVIDSRFDMQYQTVSRLFEGESLEPQKFDDINLSSDLEVVVTDEGKGKFYSDLVRRCYTASNRVEKRLSSVVVQQLLENYYQNNPCSESEYRLSSFQKSDGGISQVSWASSDLGASAWSSYVALDQFDRPKLLEYFKSISSNRSIGVDRKILSYWGKSLTGESEINGLKQLLEQASEYNDKVTLGIALASLGDKETALDIYYDLLAEYAYQASPYIRIESNTKSDNPIEQTIVDTAYALLLGDLVLPDYNTGMYAYLDDYSIIKTDTVIDLATLSFIESEIKKLPETSTKVTIESPSLGRISRELQPGRGTVFTVPSQDSKKFFITVDAGKAEIARRYNINSTGLNNIQIDDRIKITRSYEKVKGSSGSEIRPGDIVRVTIDYDIDKQQAPAGSYLITEHLPSGLAYINNPKVYGLSTNYWVSEAENNVLKFYGYNSAWRSDYWEKPIVYYARALHPGTYTAEPVVIQYRSEISIFNFADKQEIIIEHTDE